MFHFLKRVLKKSFKRILKDGETSDCALLKAAGGQMLKCKPEEISDGYELCSSSSYFCTFTINCLNLFTKLYFQGQEMYIDRFYL